MDKKNLGKNQSYTRVLNNKLVLNALREHDSSATILADQFQLSNASMSFILKDLLDKGFIKIAFASSATGKGRKQVHYTVNDKYGLIVVVGFSDFTSTIVVSNLKEEILDRVVSNVERYDLATLQKIIVSINTILSNPKYRGIPLRNIVVSIPGVVNTTTGELFLSKHFDKELFQEKNFIAKLFEKQFNVPFLMANDINLSMLGEMSKGCLKDIKNAMLIHVDIGVGGALAFNHQLYEGNLGFAGELGPFSVWNDGKTQYIDDVVSLRSILKYLNDKNKTEMKVNDLIEAYHKDSNVSAYVNETAGILGRLFKDIASFLDLSDIVISGRVKEFGADYLHCIQKELSTANNPINAQFSSLSFEAITIGAINKAINLQIELSLESNGEGKKANLRPTI